jgi:hypothetical protein
MGRPGDQPGWYDDPDRPGLRRWWDGAQWRGQAAAVGPEGPPPDSFAVAALVSAFLFIPVAPIWFGLRARKRIKESGGEKAGDGVALLAIAFGVITLVAVVVGLVIYLV